MPSPASPRLRFFGVAAYELLHANGRRILVDPYLDDCPGNPMKSSQLDQVDLVVVSHAAMDHLGDTEKIARQHGCPVICGGEVRAFLGVCYHSATVLAPGYVRHAGQGKTFMGELDGSDSPRLRHIVKTFNDAGVAVEPSGQVLKEIWSKLALNVATLPTSSAVRITADHLLDAPEMQELMQGLLREVVIVAHAQNIPLDFDERWNAITTLLRKLAPNTKGSMLQDVENRRQTEIDVMCGAINEAGARLAIPTPFNRAMIGLIKGLERSFASAA